MRYCTAKILCLLFCVGVLTYAKGDVSAKVGGEHCATKGGQDLDVAAAPMLAFAKARPAFVREHLSTLPEWGSEVSDKILESEINAPFFHCVSGGWRVMIEGEWTLSSVDGKILWRGYCEAREVLGTSLSTGFYLLSVNGCVFKVLKW